MTLIKIALLLVVIFLCAIIIDVTTKMLKFHSETGDARNYVRFLEQQKLEDELKQRKCR